MKIMTLSKFESETETELLYILNGGTYGLNINTHNELQRLQLNYTMIY